MSNRKKPVVLLILDGWGYSETEKNNAIFAAKKPNWDKLWEKYPHTLIRASESAVGLPANQMGNSEVGHLNLGAGRVVYQEISRIDHALQSGSFFTNGVLTKSVDSAIENNKSIHIMGLLSDGGVHSHDMHIHAMVKLAADRGAQKIYVHAFLDGRDTSPKSAKKYLESLNNCLEETGVGQVASIVGRYFSMDRDNRWDRVKSSYDVITHGLAEFQANTALEGLEQAYLRGESDEFVKATCIHSADQAPVKIEDGDSVIFMNFRSDRARQITQPFIEPDFDAFDSGGFPSLGSFVSLTEYKSTFDVEVAFPPERLRNVFGSYISDLGLRQLRIAETEKYAHVTFFLNGGVEEPFPGEDRILVPSPNVATYDLQPEMNAPELTEKLVNAVNSEKYDAIICNYANPDMVGHTGDFDATVKAIEALDSCLSDVVDAIIGVGGEVLITADHGNAEQMADVSTGQAHTAHTTNPVPFIYVGRNAELAPVGALSDVTPTMLYLMGIDKPAEMGGQSLVTLI
ncbi:MAG: 2,3-bisphosphoglycerate-independent phosphoglycerate mutase [Gammaproteobacteria bacterium]|nr:2,3-bisphosphoglycerate-independent phosphoglycerate mutase [Gammaproteobacteria bacterium]